MRRSLLPYLSGTVFASARKAQDAARENGIDDQPDRRERDDDIGYDRPDAAIPHEDRGNEVEIEYAVQTPIHCSEQHEDVRYDVRNDH